MPSPLQRVETSAMARREALEAATARTANFLEAVEAARADHGVAEIAEAAGMTRGNLYAMLKRGEKR